MNVSRSLTFLWTPWSAAVSALLVLVAAGLCFVAWRRSGYRRSQGVLEGIRFTIVCLGAVLLNQPEWVEEYRPEEKPSVAVLWDASPSMETRDVIQTRRPVPTASPLTRREAIASLADAASWDKLRGRMNVVVQSFSPKAVGHGTDLYEPLAQAPETFQNLRGIVLASDGDWTEGQPPVQAAARLRALGVPIFAVPIGSPTRLPDIELINLDAPTFGVAGKAVRVPFTIDSSLPREHVTTVTLKTSDGDEVTKEVRVAPMGRTSDAVIWKPKGTGDFTLALNVPAHPDEMLSDNNQLSTPISIREEKLKVLVVESYPRWEYRYLRNALSRDPGVEVSCLLFHPGLSKAGGGNKDYLKQFPAGLDELSKYDVVFIGDVGLDDGQLTSEQCRLLKGLVEHQASGLVFMPGIQGRQFSLLETELGDLCPVALDPNQPGGWGSRTPNHFELTELGRRSLLTKLADTEDDNAEVWEGLPGFQWYAPALRAKAGSDVLAVHKDITNESGRIPLLATRTFGAGKVLFMGTDGAWRWRKGVEDKYHYRFWGQVVRWMAYQRNMAKGETMRLYYVPDQPRMNKVLTFHANVMDRSGEPLRGGDVSARITAPSGKAEVARFTSAGDEWGEYTGRFTATEAGPYKVALICKQTGATLDATFFVQGATAERVGRPSRPEVLEELARVTRGKVVEPDKLDDVVRTLAALPDPPPAVRRLQLWSHGGVAAVMIVLMGAFWVGRKAIGLV
ncbi:membrane protein [Singulisphaera acidiphila]|uniref:Glutamine amidotransferase domain-containing protein n=1 Tax=Singulisphaera acidiphila (strain ATCC BAA-1392 / DSM 18658 / VKM B-2454 / MOB10) TaxID=886293 RepID=L0DFV8_SINAD|nr:membrane protein [Singulisphaera acidiphila]AGA27740.1 hypothetical protein Sinac_3483 [Singulisphaera acidiphila DSM 18658]